MIRNKIEHKNFFWIDIENPSEQEVFELKLPFVIDPNFVEDALEVGHLPKIEITEDYTFMILRAYTASIDEKAIEVGQISNKIAFFIHPKGLITVHRAVFEFLDFPHHEFHSCEELTLALINQILLTFEKPLRLQADTMDEMERDIFINKSNKLTVESLYYEKAKARLSKKILLITQSMMVHYKVGNKSLSDLQDLKDTLVNLILQSEEIIEDANSLLNSYMSFTAQKSNDVMKLLTVFSAFFLPLTFIAGLYGMNFKYMPELEMKSGYYIILGVMLGLVILIFWWFKKNKVL